ncbi:MAG: hypothetical protein AAGB22_05385 [Bacteroidota bacterium]
MSQQTRSVFNPSYVLIVTMGVLILFSVIMVLLWHSANGASVECPNDTDKINPEYNKAWMGYFQTGFTVLASALTSIIGYYFGNRGIQDAEKRAQEADQSQAAAQDAKTQAEKHKETAERLFDELASRQPGSDAPDTASAPTSIEVFSETMIAPQVAL